MPKSPILWTLPILLLAGCGREETSETSTPATPASVSESAVAEAFVPPVTVELQPTEGNSVSGTLTLAYEDDGAGGVRVTGNISGLEPDSKHGFHIHETGDCSAPDASSAGGHFSPLGHPHGGPGAASHVGDMGNITASAEGVAAVDARAAQATLSGDGPTNVSGKAIVVHGGEDDLTSQPSGDSGARIACGVIPGGQ